MTLRAFQQLDELLDFMYRSIGQKARRAKEDIARITEVARIELFGGEIVAANDSGRKFLGWEVLARPRHWNGEKPPRFKRVSGKPFQVESAANDFVALWLKAHPEQEAYIAPVIKGGNKDGISQQGNADRVSGSRP